MSIDRSDLMRRWAPDLYTDHLRRQYVPELADDDMADEVDDEESEPVEEEPETGVMVAFFLNPAVANQLALCECDDPAECDCSTCDVCPEVPAEASDPEEAEELHVTLAYLGKVGEDIPPEAEAELIKAVTAWADGRDPIIGVINGIGISDNPGEVVTYASVDAPDLPAARQELLGEMEKFGLTAKNNHGYIPHITLCYGDCRSITVPRLPLAFGTATVAFGGNFTEIPFGKAVEAPADDAMGDDMAGMPQMSSLQVKERVEQAKVTAHRPDDWSFVSTINGHTVVTTSATVDRREKAAGGNPHMLWIKGRYVGAESPNRNNAYWSAGDLEMGRPTVANGPLNWLHEERHVIGSITDAQFVPRRQQIAAETSDPHIVTTAAIWRWLYPEESSVVEMASDSGMLSQSMECISASVQCCGTGGCGQSYSYEDYNYGRTCSHLMERSTVRRFVNPTFLGGAVIVPPSRPGWADADTRTIAAAEKQAESAYDQAGRPDIPASQWESIMQGVMTFARNLG